MNTNDLIDYRIWDPQGDKNFIYATWLRGLFYGDSWFRKIPKPIFMECYHKVLDSILSRSNLEVRIACLKDDPSVILGYSIARRGTGSLVVDWVFVKKAWRGIGIARNLVPADVTDVTHLTKDGECAMQKLKNVPTFNPFLI